MRDRGLAWPARGWLALVLLTLSVRPTLAQTRREVPQLPGWFGPSIASEELPRALHRSSSREAAWTPHQIRDTPPGLRGLTDKGS